MAENTLPLREVRAAILRRPLTMGYAAQLIDHLAYAIRSETKYPSAPDLHARLEAIESSARRGRSPVARERVMRELEDLCVFGLLTNGDPQIEMALTPLFVGPVNLRFVARLAAAARARKPRRQGRGKFFSAACPDALKYCALIVSVAWQKDTGAWPGKGHHTAHLLCELLWLAAGGASHGGVAARGGALTAWRKHLAAARRYRPPHRAGLQVESAMARMLAKLLPPPEPTYGRATFEQIRWRGFYDHPAFRRRVPVLPIEADPLRAARRALLAQIMRRFSP